MEKSEDTHVSRRNGGLAQRMDVLSVISLSSIIQRNLFGRQA